MDYFESKNPPRDDIVVVALFIDNKVSLDFQSMSPRGPQGRGWSVRHRFLPTFLGEELS
jgi:hypothetical protein